MPVQPTRSRERHAVRSVTIAVLILQALVQGLVAHSVATRSWWSSEWVRLQLHLAHPTAPYAQQPVPHPGWQVWVPSAATSVLVTTALVLLALLVARVGRGAWLLAVAALPLVPTELAPGTWAPPLPNQVAYALVWPAGATEPQTTWAWVSAAISAVLVVLPAATLAATRNRPPWLSPGQVLGRLLPVGVVATAWLGWRAYNGVPADVLTAGWRTILVIVGALAVTGVVRRGQVLAVLVVLPAIAAGAMRWTTTVDGVPQLVTDASAWWMSVAAVSGGVFAAYVQPRLARGLRGAWWVWRDALHAHPDDEAAGDAELAATEPTATEVEETEAVDGIGVNVQADTWPALHELEALIALVPDDASGLEPLQVRLDEADEVIEPTDSYDSRVSRRRARGASGRSGGRHRA